MRGAGIVVLAVVIVVTGLKFMVPIAANLFFGLGVEVPVLLGVPPAIAGALYFIGMPVAFAGMVALLAQLIRSGR